MLGHIAGEVWTIERIDELAAAARIRLDELGEHTVHVVTGDGTLGLPEQAPFDAVIVTAGGPHIPAALLDQLVDGGRLVMPVGDVGEGQRLVRVRRRAGADGTDEHEELGLVRFVPLIGEDGWSPR